MKDRDKSKQYYYHNGKEIYIDTNNEITTRKNKIRTLLSDFLYLEKEKNNIHRINEYNVYFKTINPDRRSSQHNARKYQEKRINLLRVIKNQIKRNDIDFIVGLYYHGDGLVLVILDAKYFYKDKRKEFILKFTLEDIKNSINEDYNLVINNDKQNKGKKIVFTNNKNFYNVFNNIENYKNTLSYSDIDFHRGISNIPFKNSEVSKLIDRDNKIFEKYIRREEKKFRNPVGQKNFRNNLIKEVLNNKTGYVDMLDIIKKYDYESLNKNLLIASHIEDFSKADDDGAFDKNNGLLLPSYIDVFFDKKLITFNPENGKIIISKALKNILGDKLINILINQKINIKYLNDDRKVFLKKHLMEFNNLND